MDLSNNDISDIGVLETVPALQYIELSHNKVKDLRPLAGLKNMSALYLGYNQIEYIYPILGLPKLASLHLSVNRITSIEGIGQLKWLSSLSLDGNQIYDLIPLDGLQNLNFLFLEYNQIQDISPLISMARSDQEGERRFALLKLYLKGNRVRKSQIEKLKEYGVRIPILGNGRPSDEGHRMKRRWIQGRLIPRSSSRTALVRAPFFLFKGLPAIMHPKPVERVSMNRLLKDIIDLSRNGFDRSPLSLIKQGISSPYSICH